jgi:hypothetical protein
MRARLHGLRRLAGTATLASALVLMAATASAQMPDLSQMNGRSLPAPDAPAGSASVRVMRQTLGNNVVGQAVTLTGADGATIGTRTTDEGGRATFEGLNPGTAYIATAVVGSERLVSQPFTQPASGGIRIVLIAGLGAPATPAAPAQAPKPATAGSITLGTQSRMIVEQADEFVEVFVLADLVNTTDGPVSLPPHSKGRPPPCSTAAGSSSTARSPPVRRRCSSATGCPPTRAASPSRRCIRSAAR